MELLLYRWSTSVQITSDLMIALFFIALARSTLRVELRPWTYAWLANLAALAVATLYWLWQPQSAVVFAVIRWAYVFSKTYFIVLLIVGAMGFVRRYSLRRMNLYITSAIAIYASIATLLSPQINQLGLIQSATIAVCFGFGVVLLVRQHTYALPWLASGFAIRSLFAAIETFAYATRVYENPWSGSELMGTLLASHSSFDTAAEWLIALGCVLALYRSIQQELMQSNRELVGTKEELQNLVDRDALTGLSNRRSLPPVLRESQLTGATILFFDLNDFKGINDVYGHQAGDECLKRFAHALRSSFRPTDHVIRYAGDEFVVISPGVKPETLAERIDSARQHLQLQREFGPPIRFSVGSAYLPVDGEPEAALRAADEAMYKEKTLH